MFKQPKSRSKRKHPVEKNGIPDLSSGDFAIIQIAKFKCSFLPFCLELATGLGD